MAGPARSLAQVVGTNLKRARERGGLSQEDVARAARDFGFSWSRSVIAAIEGGRRELEAGELLLLPAVLDLAMLEDGPTLAELIRSPDDNPTMIEVIPGAAFDDDVLGRLLSGEHIVPGLQNFEAVIPLTRASMAKAGDDFKRLKEYRRWWPQAQIGVLQLAERAAAGDAEQKAARRLGVPAVAVSVLAFRSWGRSLTAERDARVSSNTQGDASRRQLQALRGHASRLLLDELRQRVDEMKEKE